MKKILTISILIVLIVVIGISLWLAKQKREQTIVTPAGTEQGSKTQRTGIIGPIGASIYMEGSHFLEYNGSRLLLEKASNKIDLNSFNGKKVIVTGEIRKTVEDNMEIMKVEEIKIANGNQ